MLSASRAHLAAVWRLASGFGQCRDLAGRVEANKEGCCENHLQDGVLFPLPTRLMAQEDGSTLTPHYSRPSAGTLGDTGSGLKLVTRR